MERIYAVLPSIFAVACITSATYFYLKLITKHFGDNLKSVSWQEKNKQKVIWAVGIPLTNVFAPALEELTFRAPIILAFGEMSSIAWYGVVGSGGLFALMHWFGKKIWVEDILHARKNIGPQPDDVDTAINLLHNKKEKEVIVRKVLHVVFTFPVGILTGYYGIKYQSLWVSFGIHAAWNVIMPVVLPLFLALGTLAFLLVALLWESVRWRWRKPK